jgi:hypothetical protein
MGKLAVKQLTQSDLTLFEWQFRNKGGGNQKSINLNANPFITQLYPALPNTDPGRVGRLPLDLFLYGPGHARVWNIQRKIIKTTSSYKNWRLNGEYILNPPDQPNRFNILETDDYAIFDFEGDLYPTGARVVFVAQNAAEDANLHAGLTDFGIGSMTAIQLSDLRFIVHAAGVPEAHPVNELLLDAAIEDAAQGGIDGTQRLLSRHTGRRMTRSELERARQRADDVGRMGEELIDGHLSIEQVAGAIDDYEWVSAENAIAPYDFTIRQGGKRVKIEVKATCGDFNQVIHISIGELMEMAESEERCALYRVYELDERKGKLRIAENVTWFAGELVDKLQSLPEGVTVDSVSIKPESLTFGPEIAIDLTGLDDEGFVLIATGP